MYIYEIHFKARSRKTPDYYSQNEYHILHGRLAGTEHNFEHVFFNTKTTTTI